MKKMLATFAVLLLSLILAPYAAAANEDITVLINGESVVWTDAKPFVNSDGRTMVPLRPVADAMGLETDWDSENRIASFTMEGVAYNGSCPWTNTIQFPIGKSTATGIASANWVESEPDIDTTTIPMDTAAVIVGGRTYAPVRYLAEYFQFTVQWDAATRTVSITEKQPSVYVSPLEYDGINLLVGTWEADTAMWSKESIIDIGTVQSSPYLVFCEDGRMAYQCWDQLYEGTYLLNTEDADTVYAVATLDNGWELTLSIYHMIMDASGLPPVEINYPAGTQITTVWGFCPYSDNTTYGIDPWLQLTKGNG